MDDYAEASEDSLLIVSRRRGRPRVEQRAIPISARIPSHEYDRLCKMAQSRDQSLSSLVRDILVLRISV